MTNATTDFNLDELEEQDQAIQAKGIQFRGRRYMLKPYLDSSPESLGLFSIAGDGTPLLNTAAFTDDGSASMDDIYKSFFRAMLAEDDVEDFIAAAMDGSMSSATLDKTLEWIMMQVVADPTSAG